MGGGSFEWQAFTLYHLSHHHSPISGTTDLLYEFRHHTYDMAVKGSRLIPSQGAQLLCEETDGDRQRYMELLGEMGTGDPEDKCLR